MNKCLITGGSGFIGRRLVPRLARTCEVVILSRDPRRAAQQLGSNYRYLGSLDELDSLNGFDTVFNLAGEPIIGKRWSDTQKQRICNSRWGITAKLTELIKASARPPRLLVSASAVGYYGGQGPQMLDETSLCHQEFSHQVCQQWEQLALVAASTKTRVCVLRFGMVLGRDGGALSKMLLPFKLGLGGPIGDGRQGSSWIHMDDLQAIFDFVMGHDSCQGIYNATAPNPVSNAEFSRALAKAIHRPCLLTMPKFALRLLMGEMATLVTEGQFVVPKRLQEEGFQFHYPTLTAALANLFDEE
jgi:uncharacterized protein